MENIFIRNLNKKSEEKFTSDFGLWLRKISDKPFKKLCNVFTNAKIIYNNNNNNLSDEEYFNSLNLDYIPTENYEIDSNKNNIVVERYPKLNENEPYIFVCNHTCPEDIETVLNIIDRNAYLVLGSIETLKYNKEAYLSFLNGMIPFDIMNSSERKSAYKKMVRVLKTNSILIFPEGSHNYNPNNLVNKLYDGPVRLALETNRKIVVLTMLKDNENNIAYIDASNPIDVSKMEINPNDSYKKNLKRLTLNIRDKMATAVYYMASRHFKQIKRSDFYDIEEEMRLKKINDAFEKMKWNKDIFEAEYLVKKTDEDRELEKVIVDMNNLAINKPSLINLLGKDWIIKEIDMKRKNIPLRMRKHLEEEKTCKISIKKK